MASDTSANFRLALISMPWSTFNRPSIQLAALKAFVERESAYQVDNFHPYLPLAHIISGKLYRQIALSSWAGEALFAPLLFPEKRTAAGKLFCSSLRGKVKPLPDFDEMVTAVEQCCEHWLNNLTLSQYGMVGFSLCFSQLFASLYMARKIKSARPELPIIFGGSSCSGDIGRSLIDHFPEIDYLIEGEGEHQLLLLCHYLAGQPLSLPAYIHQRGVTSASRGDTSPTLADMDTLPYPDYRPYFNEIQQYFRTSPFIPLLPIEFSRGCWWHKCTFCNLNLQWPNYRFKTSGRMMAETLHLAKSHECLHFTFTDNVLPPKEADAFFGELSRKEVDFDFFAEIRPQAEAKKLALYRRAGLKNVQVGIEALSTSLLEKMNKGTTVIDNIAAMKMCSAAAIRLEGNLITDFPGTTEEEIAETMTNLDFVLPFLPLQAATFFLGYGSPIHAGSTAGSECCIDKIIPHAKNRSLFPARYLQSMVMLINSYQGDKNRQKKLWQPVHRKIRAWQKFHRDRGEKGLHPLFYRDGESFLIIYQQRKAGLPLQHRLRKTSREIYLRCEQPVKIATLSADFPRVALQTLRKFIDEMCDKRLMFQENERVLSLAVPYSYYS